MTMAHNLVILVLVLCYFDNVFGRDVLRLKEPGETRANNADDNVDVNNWAPISTQLAYGAQVLRRLQQPVIPASNSVCGFVTMDARKQIGSHV